MNPEIKGMYASNDLRRRLWVSITADAFLAGEG